MVRCGKVCGNLPQNTFPQFFSQMWKSCGNVEMLKCGKLFHKFTIVEMWKCGKLCGNVEMWKTMWKCGNVENFVEMWKSPSQP